MKVTVYHQDKSVTKSKKHIITQFIKFLFKEYPLNEDLKIYFLSERVGKMTTGSRTTNHTIKVLSKNRINRDILRTLSHEWVHEYQMSVVKRKKQSDIGSQNENEANALSGSLIKKFEKKFPNFEDMMYEED